MDNSLKTKLLYEISQIDKLLNDSKPLFDLCKLKVPDFIEISAGAMVLHSFYGGIENILTLIFKHYDGQLPNGNKWHMEILEKAFVSDKNRKNIFSMESQKRLEEYLKFRHFVRHAYGFQLEWERMEDLINGINIFWEIIKNNIREPLKTDFLLPKSESQESFYFLLAVNHKNFYRPQANIIFLPDCGLYSHHAYAVVPAK